MARMMFHYQPGRSPLHRWDCRCKFIALLSITFALMQTSVIPFSVLSVLLIALFLLARIRIRVMLQDLKFWSLWLLFLFFVQAFFSQGDRAALIPGLPISLEGVKLGFWVSWRLGLILGYALLFTAVTRPREWVEALSWFLRPLPFINGRRLALMVSLALGFFSRFLDQAEEVRLALRARLGEQIRTPLRRARNLALPLLRRSLKEVEETTFALLARGYREDLVLSLPPFPFAHLIPLVFLWGLLLALSKLPYNSI